MAELNYKTIVCRLPARDLTEVGAKGELVL